MAKHDTVGPVYQGEDAILAFTMDPVPGGGIGGWTFRLDVRNVTVVLSKSPAAIVGAPTGDFSFTLLPAETALLRPGLLDYEVRRTDTGENRVVASGSFSVLKRMGTS